MPASRRGLEISRNYISSRDQSPWRKRLLRRVDSGALHPAKIDPLPKPKPTPPSPAPSPEKSPEMSNTSLPTEDNKEQEEKKAEVEIGAAQGPPLPDEGCVPLAEAPMPSEGEPGPAPHVHCQTWLLDMLDDVRYLISCTNWY